MKYIKLLDYTKKKNVMKRISPNSFSAWECNNNNNNNNNPPRHVVAVVTCPA
jgi:hypothetical protein